MANKRITPSLDLSSELPEVVSRDFNLFYKPEPTPEIAGLKEFTRSLDNFVSGAGTSMALVAEQREKTENENLAVQKHLELKSSFNDAVKKGDIPKEVNPYFIQKYQQLELGEKARKFKDSVIQKYGELGVKENADAGAFDNFYNSELKKFFRENQLGLFQPNDLAKGFFNQTDKFRNELYSQHSNSQLGKVTENYKKGFKNDIQGFLTDDGTENSLKNIGDKITNYIKDKTANGLGNTSAQEYLLEALKEYVGNTNDFDFAQKVLDRVPNFIKLGTDSLGNVKGLQDEFNQLQDTLIDRQIAQEERAIKQNAIKYSQEKRFLKGRLDDENFDFQQFKKSNEYTSLTREGKEFAETYWAKSSTSFSTKDNEDVKNKVNEFITNGEYDEAEKYLLEIGSNQLTKNTWNELNQKIDIYDATKTNGLINNSTFKNFKDDIDTKVKAVNKNGTVVDPRLANDLDAYARQWLVENTSKYPTNSLELRDAFKEAITKEYNDILKNFVSEKYKTSKTEKFDPNKIGKQSSVPSVTDTGDAQVVYMPQGLTARQQTEFKKANKGVKVVQIGQTSSPPNNLARSRDAFNQRVQNSKNTEVANANNKNST